MVGEIFSSFQWKIRRVLAYSLHDVALILGQERACSDLLSVLDEYTTKDVDDVKLGVLTPRCSGNILFLRHEPIGTCGL